MRIRPAGPGVLAGLWDELRRRDRWLLVYDNAEGPRELAPYRPPGGAGRVMITSRMSTWDRATAAVRLDVLDRDEAVAFLRHRAGSSDTATVAALAGALGDLPLALERRTAYMDETHTLPADYLALYREHGAELAGAWGAAVHRADGGDHLAGRSGPGAWHNRRSRTA